MLSAKKPLKIALNLLFEKIYFIPLQPHPCVKYMLIVSILITLFHPLPTPVDHSFPSSSKSMSGVCVTLLHLLLQIGFPSLLLLLEQLWKRHGKDTLHFTFANMRADALAEAFLC